MITVEHVTKTYGAFTAVDAGIQIFTERLGQAIFGAHVLAGDLSDAVAVMDPFHVVRLAGDALHGSRRRVQQELHGHRGRRDDPLSCLVRQVLRSR